MRPILEQQTFINTVNLKGTVDGTTENMKFRGGEIINLCTEPTAVKKSTKGPGGDAGRINFKFNTDSLEWQQDYTIFYRITDNKGTEQDDIKKLQTNIVTSGGVAVGSNQYISAVTGRGKVHIQTTRQLQPEQVRTMTVSFFWHSGTLENASATITDVMLIKGDWTHTDIPFFEDKKGFGPEITVISHNKNIVSSFKLADKLYPGASNQIANNNALKILNFYTDKLEKDTNYTVSFKRHENKTVTKQFFIYGSNSEPTNGVKYTQIISNPAETSLKFNTGKYKYISVYLGFVFNKDDIKDIAYDIQIEAGDKATPYQPPGFSHKTYNIKHELFEGDVLEYSCDYKKWVINHREKHPSQSDTVITRWITDIIDPFTYTFDKQTWIAVRDKDNIINGSIEFEYPKDPHYAHYGKHMKVLLELESGEVINTFRYGSINKQGGFLRLKDSYYGDPDRNIILEEIVKIIHLD